jgi:hypothetical protein
MDASQYLRYKVQSMNQFIKRGGPVDAGLQTMRLAQRVTSPGVFSSPVNQTGPVAPPACCTKSPGYSNTESMPVLTPCVGGACTEVSSIAATPYIYIAGCPIPYTAPLYYTSTNRSAIRAIVGRCECYQSTPAKDREISQAQACAQNTTIPGSDGAIGRCGCR